MLVSTTVYATNLEYWSRRLNSDASQYIKMEGYVTKRTCSTSRGTWTQTRTNPSQAWTGCAIDTCTNWAYNAPNCNLKKYSVYMYKRWKGYAIKDWITTAWVKHQNYLAVVCKNWWPTYNTKASCERWGLALYHTPASWNWWQYARVFTCSKTKNSNNDSKFYWACGI